MLSLVAAVQEVTRTAFKELREHHRVLIAQHLPVVAVVVHLDQVTVVTAVLAVVVVLLTLERDKLVVLLLLVMLVVKVMLLELLAHQAVVVEQAVLEQMAA
jgi:hypothetical protein